MMKLGKSRVDLNILRERIENKDNENYIFDNMDDCTYCNEPISWDRAGMYELATNKLPLDCFVRAKHFDVCPHRFQKEYAIIETEKREHQKVLKFNEEYKQKESLESEQTTLDPETVNKKQYDLSDLIEANTRSIAQITNSYNQTLKVFTDLMDNYQRKLNKYDKIFDTIRMQYKQDTGEDLRVGFESDD